MAERLPVLTYHAISDDPGPTCIPAATFRMQIETLAALGYRSMTVAEFLAWRRGELAGEGRVLITFDDAFVDFETAAWPILKANGFSAVVFLPTGKLGGVEDWDGPASSRRPLLDWSRLQALASEGVEFGGHGVHHLDLTRLTAETLTDEVRACGAEIARRTGQTPAAFAQPFGHTDARVEAEIAQAYDVAFGTRLACAERGSPAANLPRIDMHYFRDPARWRAFLKGSTAYLAARQTLRGVRETLERLRPAPAAAQG